MKFLGTEPPPVRGCAQSFEPQSGSRAFPEGFRDSLENPRLTQTVRLLGRIVRPLTEAVGHDAEEAGPALFGLFVHRVRKTPALTKDHLGIRTPEVAEHDRHQLVVVVGLIPQREYEEFGSDHLEIPAPEAQLASVRTDEHGCAPLASFSHVHRHARFRNVHLPAAVPFGETLRLGPLIPHALARRAERARQQYAARTSAGGGSVHRWSRRRSSRASKLSSHRGR